MSVVVARNDRDPAEVLAGHEGYGLVALTVADLQDLGQQVISDPLPEEPDHAVVRGIKTKTIRREMAKRSSWVILPPG